MAEMKTTVKSRNYSLDLLRIISMAMIIILHMGSHGGILRLTKNCGGYYFIELFIQALCIVAVNVFVLISAYFLVDQKFRFSKIARIIAEVWFYSWIIAFLFNISGLELVSIREAVLPISFSQNWFATSYIGLYLIFPILNIVIDNTSKKQLEVVIFLLFMILGLWSDIIPSANPFGANPGASTVWFIVLYFISAYVKRYIKTEHCKFSWMIYIATSIVTVLFQILLVKISNIVPALSVLSEDMYYYRYNSLFVVVASIALFITFLQIQVFGGIAQKILCFLQPLCFGVYLIHDNPN